MTINIEELKRDREAGTDGSWYVAKNGEGEMSIGSCETSYILEPTQEEIFSYKEMVIDGCGCCGSPYGNDGKAEHDARRIARLPDLEAAFLEAVEALQKIAAGASISLDDDLMQGWRKIATDRIDIARDFLEKLK